MAAGKAVNYLNAGTVEFLLDADNNFYFMEVNAPYPGGTSGHRVDHRYRSGQGAGQVGR